MDVQQWRHRPRNRHLRHWNRRTIWKGVYTQVGKLKILSSSSSFLVMSPTYHTIESDPGPVEPHLSRWREVCTWRCRDKCTLAECFFHPPSTPWSLQLRVQVGEEILWCDGTWDRCCSRLTIFVCNQHKKMGARRARHPSAIVLADGARFGGMHFLERRRKRRGWWCFHFHFKSGNRWKPQTRMQIPAHLHRCNDIALTKHALVPRRCVLVVLRVVLSARSAEIDAKAAAPLRRRRSVDVCASTIPMFCTCTKFLNTR